MLDMICHTTLRVDYFDSELELQFRFLVILLIQCLFQFRFWTATLTIALAYLSFAGIEMYSFEDSTKLEKERVYMLLVWFLVQVASSLALQIVINAIGSLYTDVYVLRSERGHITKSQAKNVFVLNKANKSVLSSQIKSKWLAEHVFCSHKNEAGGNSEFNFSQKIFKAIDEAVFNKDSADSMKFASELSQSQEFLSLEKIIDKALAQAPGTNKSHKKQVFSVSL